MWAFFVARPHARCELGSKWGSNFFALVPIEAMKRPYGTGQIYVKSGAFYGRWRTPDGRRRNKRLGPVRPSGSSEGLTRAMAEHALRKVLEAEPTLVVEDGRGRTVDDAASALRERLELQGARKSYRQNCESMQRVHISPAIGSRRVGEVSTADVEALVRSVLRRGLAPKSVRNVITFLHSVFGLAVDRGWCVSNPVTRAARPRRRSGGGNADLQFLTVAELDAVIAAIPNEVVRRTPAPTRHGRRGPSPPPPPDFLGPVLRVLILAAAVTGLRQSELLGIRWRDIDVTASRVRVRNAFVRGEHSSEGKSDLSTRLHRAGPNLSDPDGICRPATRPVPPHGGRVPCRIGCAGYRADCGADDSPKRTGTHLRGETADVVRTSLGAFEDAVDSLRRTADVGDDFPERVTPRISADP
jgi:integrase